MTTFPYLKVARDHGVPYGLVLWLADVLDCDLAPIHMMEPPERHRLELHPLLRWSFGWYNEPWATATTAAWLRERDRRRGVA